jgi:ArsR family transcriptional regulator
MQPANVIQALAALAQEHRLAAFRLLVQTGAEGVPAGEIAHKLGSPPSSMSFHLAQLAHAGLVTQRRESRSVIYVADYGAMNGLMAYLTENCCSGLPCEETAVCAPQPDNPQPDKEPAR